MKLIISFKDLLVYRKLNPGALHPTDDRMNVQNTGTV
jgi:hypothetical protein